MRVKKQIYSKIIYSQYLFINYFNYFNNNNNTYKFKYI